MGELLPSLLEQLQAKGWRISAVNDGLDAEKEVILSSWFLGSRRIRLQLRCELDGAARRLSCRERSLEVSRGLAPPSISVSRYSQQGLTLEENRRDVGVGGGGEMAYGEARAMIKTLCESMGWQFGQTC